MTTGRKGQNIITDIIIIPATLLLFIMMLFFAHYVYIELRDSTDIFTGQNTTDSNEIMANFNTTFDMFPWIFGFFIVGIIIALGLTAYFLESNMTFVIVGILVILIALLISVPFRNAYEDVRGGVGFETTNDQFVVANKVMDNMPMVVLFAGIIFLFIMFARRQSGRGGGGQY